jgi:transcriptional regulator with XRE-family HTH domain
VAKRLRSEGAIQLGRLGLSDPDVAARVGCKREQIAYWRLGTRVPAPASRARLRTVLGIPEDAWDRYPARAGAQAPAAPTAPPTAAPAPAVASSSTPIDYAPVAPPADTVAAKARRLEQLVVAGLTMLERDESLTAVERFRLQSECQKLLDKLGRLTGESQVIGESRLVRLPAFRRAVDEIVRALRPWPAAQVAAADALAALGGS